MLVEKIDHEFNASLGTIRMILEVPMLAQPVKYEVDKASGALFVDRFLGTTMSYPCHYGFAPNTMADDGDPIDILLWCCYDLAPGSVINVRVVGYLDMEDESGVDYKLLAVPAKKVTPLYDKIQDISDMPEALLAQIKHFFEHYKDLEPKKWVKVRQFHGAKAALGLLTDLIK